METLINDGQYNIGHICTRQRCRAAAQIKLPLVGFFRDLNILITAIFPWKKTVIRIANLLEIWGYPWEIGSSLSCPDPGAIIVLRIFETQAVAGVMFSSFGEDALWTDWVTVAPAFLYDKKVFT